MLGTRTVTCAARDSKLRDFGFCEASLKVVIRLCLDVVTKDAVGVPLCKMLLKIRAVGIKERPIQTHPSSIDQVISYR